MVSIIIYRYSNRLKHIYFLPIDWSLRFKQKGNLTVFNPTQHLNKYGNVYINMFFYPSSFTTRESNIIK